MIKNLIPILLVSVGVKAQLSDCEPYFSRTVLEVNEIRAHIGLPNNFFNDGGDPGFAVPAADSTHGIFAHSDWIGGYTAEGQLHLSAGTYFFMGNSDFYTGPLRNDGSAATSSELCESYAQLYRAERIDAILHQEFYDRSDLVAQGADISILTEPPFENGYQPPEYFYSWPAHNYSADYDFYLAPFFDRNQDGLYDPDDGDYPRFDISGDCSCHQPDLSSPEHLQGHEAVWQVYNDSGLHTESGGSPLGIEVHCTSFGFNTCNSLDATIFQRKRIINRSSNTYLDTYIGQWTDTDIGCPTDDYTGCDVARGLAYAYNADQFDADCDGITGYGQSPPIISFQFLAGPYADEDGIDNPLTSNVQNALDSAGIVYNSQGIGYGDGIIDNERMKMTRFTSYIRDSGIGLPINGDPDTAIEFYQYLDGLWLDGTPVTYGGDGTSGTLLTNYMYSGLSDPFYYGTGGENPEPPWGEVNEPGDRKLLAITGPFTFEPGEVQEIVTAFNSTQGFASIDVNLNSMRIASDYIQAQFEYCFQLVPPYEVIEEFTFVKDENEVTFSLPYYYEYEAEWDFGDGYSAQGLSVEHEYSEAGDYAVCVTVYSCSGPEEICQTITITATDVEEIETDQLVLLYPNPADDRLYFHSTRLGKRIVSVNIYDVKGRMMQKVRWTEDHDFMILEDIITQGFYTAQITYEDGMERGISFLKK